MSQRPTCACGKLVRIAFGWYRTLSGQRIDAYCGRSCAAAADDDRLAATQPLPGVTWVALDADDDPRPFPYPAPARTRIDRLTQRLSSRRAAIFLDALIQQPRRYTDPRWNALARAIDITHPDASRNVLADLIDRWLATAPYDVEHTLSWTTVCTHLQLSPLPPSWLADADVWGLLDAIATTLPRSLASWQRAGLIATPAPGTGVPVLALEPIRQALKRWIVTRTVPRGTGQYRFLATAVDADIALRA